MTAALSEARARLQQMEHNLAAVEDERKKLSAALDEANERRQSEVYALTLKLDAMRSRSTAAEKLLVEMRQSLVARTEEIRATESKLMEAVLGRSGEKKADQLIAANEAHDRQNKKLEQTRLSLTGRSNVPSGAAITSANEPNFSNSDLANGLTSRRGKARNNNNSNSS